MKTSPGVVIGFVVLGAAGPAAADPNHLGAAIWDRSCKSCHVATRVQTESRAADGRTVLYQAITKRTDQELLAYVTKADAKRPKDCEVKLLSIYDAPNLLAFLRLATKPEPKDHLPIVRAADRGTRSGAKNDDARRQVGGGK